MECFINKKVATYRQQIWIVGKLNGDTSCRNCEIYYRRVNVCYFFPCITHPGKYSQVLECGFPLFGSKFESKPVQCAHDVTHF